MAVTATATSKDSDTASDTGSWQPKTTSTYDKNDTITLLVGPQEHEMMAYGSYISRSDFFRVALKKEWTEGRTRTIKLPEEEPEIVEQYLDYVLGKGLPTDSTKMDPREGEVYAILTMLFAFGERVLDSRLRNAIIAEFIRFTTIPAPDGSYIYPSQYDVNNIYNCTTSASPSRRLTVDLYMRAGDTTWVEDTLHPAFLKDLAEALMLQVQTSGLPCRI